MKTLIKIFNEGKLIDEETMIINVNKDQDEQIEEMLQQNGFVYDSYEVVEVV